MPAPAPVNLTTTTKMRRKSSPHRSDSAADSSEKLDQLLLSSAICNGEDLSPFVRKAFASGKPDSLLHNLRLFARSKESEIEDLCRAHYEDFILAVDDLRSLLSDVDSLKSALSRSNSDLQSVAAPLLSSLDSFIETRTVDRNAALALSAARACARLADLCARANAHLSASEFYLALKCADALEREHLPTCPSSTLRRMLERRIPAIRGHVERQISKEFGDWLVQIRVVSRHLGQIAIGQASAARQREEELRVKQRQAEEQTRLSLRECIYALQEEEDDDPIASAGSLVDDAGGGGAALGFDLTPLYRAYHIHQTLGLQERFKQYYFENRKLQLTSDFQVSTMTPFLESHQTFFAQIAGFFIVEDRIFRTSGGLITKFEVENLWETAVSKMCSVLEDQFSRMQTANHLLLIKDYVSLLSVTLRRHGYPVDALHDVLGKHRDKYHELLLSDCRKQISEALAADKFEQMLMRKEYEYSMNVLSFQLQTSDIIPAFPYVAPFSSTVPDCCRIVRSFIGDSVSFMSYGGQLDFYDFVKKYLDRLLGEVLDGALMKLTGSSIHTVSPAMQVAANMAVFERACDFFFRYAAQLSGIPVRMVDRGARRQFPLKNAQDAAEVHLASLLKKKVDGFMEDMVNISWLGDEFPVNGNEYAHEVVLYLETLVSTAQQILPVQMLERVLYEVMRNISENIVGFLLGDSVKRFNENAVLGLDVDVKVFEAFADNQSHLFEELDSDAKQLRGALVEARQLVNLLMSNHPESFLNPVIREKSYHVLDYKKVVAISEKLRDPSDRLFGSFGTRGLKQNPKKKSLDILIRRLKDAN